MLQGVVVDVAAAVVVRSFRHSCQDQGRRKDARTVVCSARKSRSRGGGVGGASGGAVMCGRAGGGGWR